MKFKKVLPFIISVIMLCTVISVTYNKKTTLETKEVQTTSATKQEIRGVWVTYMDLDMQDTDMTFTSFINKFNEIADTSKEKGFNTLIVQVRPFSDALYKSDYFPYSHILTGTQGKDPGYDPLKYICEYCHKIGLQVHAWINPYRIKTESNPTKLAKNHPYYSNKSITFEVNDSIYFNPCEEQARELIKNGIKEIVENYEIDGIQFDDYFYPTSNKNIDKNQYKAYKQSVGAGKALSLTEWRIANINILIAEVYNTVHNTDKNLVFGISPQGNIDNNYELCADVKNWCTKEGYIDYICPQLYYSLNNPALTFENALNQWVNLNYADNVQLYIGICGYKAGTNDDEGTWKNSNETLKEEVEIIKSKGIKGILFYSYADLTSKTASKEVSNMIKVLN